jgi:hypothetical protein
MKPVFYQFKWRKNRGKVQHFQFTKAKVILTVSKKSQQYLFARLLQALQ